MTTKPKTRKAPAADPIFAAIAEHKTREKEWLRLSCKLDNAEVKRRRPHDRAASHSCPCACGRASKSILRRNPFQFAVDARFYRNLVVEFIRILDQKLSGCLDRSILAITFFINHIDASTHGRSFFEEYFNDRIPRALACPMSGFDFPQSIAFVSEANPQRKLFPIYGRSSGFKGEALQRRFFEVGELPRYRTNLGCYLREGLFGFPRQRRFFRSFAINHLNV